MAKIIKNSKLRKVQTCIQADQVRITSPSKDELQEVIRMLRELKGWTQRELAKRSGISVTNLSLLERGRVEIGKRRAERVAKAFGVHPAIIMFPEYEAKEIGNAAA